MAQSKPLRNEWNEPFHVYGPGEGKLRHRVLRQVPDYRISRDTWEEETKQSNNFLGKLSEKIHERAQRYREELDVSKTFVKQASARQGLKISAPDEYDVIIPFKMKGLDFQTCKLRDNDGKVIPGMMRQRVLNKDDISRRNPQLAQKEVFTTRDGTTYINTKNLHERIWTKIVDKAVVDIKKEMPNSNIVRRNHPPAINLQITDSRGKITNFDIVPAHHIGTEKVLIPANITGKKDTLVELPNYSLLKYDNHNNPRIRSCDKSSVWRQDTSSYERAMADLCKSTPERQYIMTANRILKSAMKELADKQNPLGQMINSYHLKTIAYHCIARLTMQDSKSKITGVKLALGHQITYLNNCVKDRFLPDFFHGNKDLEKIFPGSTLTENHREQNLFWKTNPRQLMAAAHGIPTLTGNLNGCFTCLAGQ